MKHLIFLVISLLFISNVQSQALYEELYSAKLDETRQLKIQLPRNYDPEGKQAYPLVVVLDGDYLFEPVVGNIDYLSYWDDMPHCIVVGINQAETRETDLEYEDLNYFPSINGSKFFEFISMEVVPFMQERYRITPFLIAIGHDLSANFINYYMFKEIPLFRSYVALSPDYAPEMVSRLTERMAILSRESFYYLATSDADIQALQESIIEADQRFATITNDKLHYKFDNFTDANHYALVGRAIPKALNEIFALYKPINGKEYKEKVLTYPGSPFEYLEKKYENIEYFYGFEKDVIENDIRAIAAACAKKNDLEGYKNLARLAQKTHPESMIGAYYLGSYHEMEGNPKKALQRYQSGLLLKSSQFINKDMLLEKIYQLKEDFGF